MPKVFQELEELEILLNRFFVKKEPNRDVNYNCTQCHQQVTKTALSLEDQNKCNELLQEMEQTFYPLCDKCAAKLRVMCQMTKLMVSIGNVLKQ